MEKEQNPIQSYYYKYGKTTNEKIIEYLNEYETLDGTDGEHFLMSVNLLV